MNNIRTKLYRVLLWGAQIGTVAMLAADRFGPGIGLTAWDIGVIDAAATGLITLGRQISDPSTPTLPSAGPVVLPEPPK